MTTIITDLKSSRTVPDQNDIVLLVNLVTYQVRYDQNSMMITGGKEDGWEASLQD